MVVTLTSIHLRRLWYFFTLSWWGLQILKQAKQEKGFIKMKNTGFGYTHYTITAWDSEDDVKRFASSGAHREAMKNSRRIATEIRIHTYQTDSFPAWKTAKETLQKAGRVYSYGDISQANPQNARA